MFCCYADECNIYVSSRNAGEHLLRDISKYLAKELGLTINDKKDAVARPWEHKLLRFSVTRHKYVALSVIPDISTRFLAGFLSYTSP